MSTTELMVKLLDESRFKVTLYIANIFKLRKCERVRKRDRNKNYFGVSIYLGHFELVCFIPFRVIFFMIIQVKNIYINWEKLRFAPFFFLTMLQFPKAFFLINCFLTNQTIYYQMSSRTNFYQICFLTNQIWLNHI